MEELNLDIIVKACVSMCRLDPAHRTTLLVKLIKALGYTVDDFTSAFLAAQAQKTDEPSNA